MVADIEHPHFSKFLDPPLVLLTSINSCHCLSYVLTNTYLCIFTFIHLVFLSSFIITFIANNLNCSLNGCTAVPVEGLTSVML